MPDTGAPWNIPYVAGTDLVSDWPTDSQDLAEAVADALDAASVGLGTNVVQTVKTDSFSLSSASWNDLTGLTATITPTSASNKVLILVHIGTVGSDNLTVIKFRISRGATPIGVPGSGTPMGWGIVSAASNLTQTTAYAFLDSPATTSATTYKVEIQGETAETVYVNQNAINNSGNSISTITAIEVAV